MKTVIITILAYSGVVTLTGVLGMLHVTNDNLVGIVAMGPVGWLFLLVTWPFRAYFGHNFYEVTFYKPSGEGPSYHEHILRQVITRGGPRAYKRLSRYQDSLHDDNVQVRCTRIPFRDYLKRRRYNLPEGYTEIDH